MHEARKDRGASPSAGMPLDRRSLLRGSVALGALALAAPLSGCALLGIEDPTSSDDEEEPQATPGTVDFDNLVVALNLDQSTWQWLQVNNPASGNHGSLVVSIPVTVTNNDEASRVLNNMYCKIYGPDGSVLPDISQQYTSDDILQRGSIYQGTSESGVVHILFRGEGTYTFEFDDLLGGKVDLEIELPSSAASGLHPIPQGSLSQADAAAAVPAGTVFKIGDCDAELAADPATYWWTQTWDEADPTWNGRWCVGVGLAITNRGSEPMTLTADMYGLYAPALYRLDDPAPWFADSAAAYVGTVQPGESVQTALFWVFDDSGTYYAVFDSDGQKVVTSVSLVSE